MGSRRSEAERRDRRIRKKYQGNEPFVTIPGYRVPWLTLSMGDVDWTDYTVASVVQPGAHCSAGIAFRYQNPRQYYLFLLEDAGRVALYLRTQDREARRTSEAWRCLRAVPFRIQAGEAYRVRIGVRGGRLSCALNDATVIRCEDATLRSGKVAFVTDNPAFFGPVSVKGILVRPRAAPLPSCAKPRLLYEVALPQTETRLDLRFLDVDGDGQREIIIAEKAEDGYGYRCIKFSGAELWNITGIAQPTSEGGDRPIQVFDINGDGRNELVLVADFQIQVRNGKTGKLLHAQSTPEPNPYYDSRRCKYPKLLGDALCPLRLARDGPPGLYIKDRYTNIWVYDHRLEVRWHRAMSTGHFPLATDLDGDGAEELLVCHTLLRSDGRQVWQLPLSDHVDGIAHASLHPGCKPEQLYLAAGEMGLIEVDPTLGAILTRHELGHIQRITIGDFLPDRPGLALLAQTLWREDRLHYLFDKDLNLLATWLAPCRRIFPLPWGESGHDLLLRDDGVLDPMTGRLVLPPLGGSVLMVLDDPRWGNGVVLVREADRVKVYGPEPGFVVPAKKRLYQDTFSHYLPEVTLLA